MQTQEQKGKKKKHTIKSHPFWFLLFSQLGDDSLPAAQDWWEENGGHQDARRRQEWLHQRKRTQTPQSSQGEEVGCLHWVMPNRITGKPAGGGLFLTERGGKRLKEPVTTTSFDCFVSVLQWFWFKWWWLSVLTAQPNSSRAPRS